MGGGKIDLTQFNATGPAFVASSQGSIPIAPVLGESPLRNLPVNFALSRSLAETAGFALADTNASYLDLGRIARVRGTLEDPKTEPDYARITLLLGQRFLPGEAGQLLRGLGGGLGGGTNSNSSGGSVPNLGGILRGTDTNATNALPGTNTAPNTNRNQPLNEILNIFGPRRQ